MLIDNKKVTEILLKYNLDIYQFWVLYLRSINDYESLGAYCNTFGLVPTERFEELERRKLIKPLGYIIENGKSTVNFLDIYVTDECLETFFKDCNIISEEIAEELFEAYPKFIEIQGKRVISTMAGDVGGVYYDKEKCLKLYLTKIKYNEELHKKIVDTVIKAKKQNLINFTFRNFVTSELWVNLFEIVKLEEEDKDITNIRVI